MKTLTALLFVLFGVNDLAFAQFSITAFPFASRNFDVKSISLGNALVSLSGEDGDARINPAGFGLDGVLQISPDYSSFSQPLKLMYDRYGLKGDYKMGRIAVGLSYERIKTGEQITTIDYPTGYGYKFNNEEVFARAHLGYHFQNNIRVGGSLNYLNSGEGFGNKYNAVKTDPVSTLSVDLALQYHFKKEMEGIVIQPSFGLALTNFGKPVSYYEEDTSPMPARLQVGAGVLLGSSQKMLQQKLFEVTLLQNVSRVFAHTKWKISGVDTSRVAMNTFESLVKSWDSYEYFDGNRLHVVEPIDQIWWHSGIELTVLETFSFRWGFEHAEEASEPLTYHSLGMGIDLYYITLDYAFVIDNPERYNYMEGHWWQLTGRIPLNGNKPDTILNEIFK